MIHVDDPRYARQHVLRGFGRAGQERLAAARVLIVGAGGLGSPAALYLAAAGVGALTLVDADVVDLTNLHRQLLYGTRDVGRPKLDAARDRLQDVNPQVTVVTHHVRMNASNALSLLHGHDVVIDATDNFPARYAINDACVALDTAFVYGSIARFQAQVSVFAAATGPCYRCLFPEAPTPGSVPTCAEEGVLGVVPGIVGLHQALEAIKLITGIGTPLIGQLLLLDFLSNDSQRITLAKRDNCPVCSVVARSERQTSTLTLRTMTSPDITVTDLAARIARGDALTVLDVREQWEYDTAQIAGSVLAPLSILADAVNALDRDAEYVVLCHHGMRSEMAAGWMRAHGFSNVTNMTGGIDAWSVSVDTTVPRY